MFTKSSRIKIEDRKSSEPFGNCRNVRKFPNQYKETFENGYPFVFLSLCQRYLIMDKLIELKIDREFAFASPQKW